jgi:integrase
VVFEMALTFEELKQLEQEISWRENRKETARKMGGKSASRKQRKIPDDYSNNKEKNLNDLYAQAIKNIDKSSYIVSADTKDKKTKQDLRKGGNNNLGIHGIIGKSTRKDVIKRGKQIIKHCHQEYGIKTLGDIKPMMVYKFLESKISTGEITPRTLQTYISQFKKFAECNHRAGVKSHATLMNSYHDALKEQYKSKKSERIRGKKENGEGMSLREARVISKKAGERSGPLAKAMVDVLIEACPRAEELMKLKWEHFDFAQKEMSLTDKNMTKNNRPRIIHEFSDKTIEKLKDIWDSGVYKNQNERIWGSHFGSVDTVRDFIKDCSRDGKVAYLGLHAFRNASKEYHIKQIEKEEKKCKTPSAKYGLKEDVVDKILRHVNANEKLNYPVEKTRKIWIPVVDSKGNQVLKSDGSIKMTVKTEIKHRKNVAVREVVRENGKVVMVDRYNKEDLMDHRIDYLKNMLVSQILGHNRSDVVGVY